MRITVLTLFPEMFNDFVSTSIIKRCLDKGVASVDFVNIRDFSKDKHNHVDDTPFGGGAGMVMKCQPVLDALESVRSENSYVILMSPAGTKYNQQVARRYATIEHLIIICGHYEGLDYRIYKHVDELVSIGDYVLTGGELAAMVISDSIIRLLDGAITSESISEESHENGLLEYPQYTKPADYNGDKVPDVLLSGHHKNIKEWRHAQSLMQTKKYRPDMFEKYELSKEEVKLLQKYEDNQ